MEEVLRQAARDRKVWRIQEHLDRAGLLISVLILITVSGPVLASLTGFYQNLNLLSSFIVTRITGKNLDPGTDQAHGDPEKVTWPDAPSSFTALPSTEDGRMEAE